MSSNQNLHPRGMSRSPCQPSSHSETEQTIHFIELMASCNTNLVYDVLPNCHTQVIKSVLHMAPVSLEHHLHLQLPAL